MFDGNNDYEDVLEMEDALVMGDLEVTLMDLEILRAKLTALLKEISMCPAVSPERRMSYVEIQMDWDLYDKIQRLFP